LYIKTDYEKFSNEAARDSTEEFAEMIRYGKIITIKRS